MHACLLWGSILGYSFPFCSSFLSSFSSSCPPVSFISFPLRKYVKTKCMSVMWVSRQKGSGKVKDLSSGTISLRMLNQLKHHAILKQKKSRAYIPPSQFSVGKPTLAHTVSPSCSSVDNAHVLHHKPKRSASLLSSPLSFQSTDRAWGKSNSGLDTRQTL